MPGEQHARGSTGYYSPQSMTGMKGKGGSDIYEISCPQKAPVSQSPAKKNPTKTQSGTVCCLSFALKLFQQYSENMTATANVWSLSGQKPFSCQCFVFPSVARREQGLPDPVLAQRLIKAQPAVYIPNMQANLPTLFYHTASSERQPSPVPYRNVIFSNFPLPWQHSYQTRNVAYNYFCLNSAPGH